MSQPFGDLQIGFSPHPYIRLWLVNYMYSETELKRERLEPWFLKALNAQRAIFLFSCKQPIQVLAQLQPNYKLHSELPWPSAELHHLAMPSRLRFVARSATLVACSTELPLLLFILYPITPNMSTLFANIFGKATAQCGFALFANGEFVLSPLYRKSHLMSTKKNKFTRRKTFAPVSFSICSLVLNEDNIFLFPFFIFYIYYIIR